MDSINPSAIELYQSMDDRTFRIYPDYYEDRHDACRKKIRQPPAQQVSMTLTPWYRQSTQFSCGPAALIMAMVRLDENLPFSRGMELDIWREATTIFMTSGHDGCHPIGLALAAHARGFEAKVTSTKKGPFSSTACDRPTKKDIITAVDLQFRRKAREAGIAIIHSDAPLKKVETALQEGRGAIVLVSTYRTTGSKARIGSPPPSLMTNASTSMIPTPTTTRPLSTASIFPLPAKTSRK